MAKVGIRMLTVISQDQRRSLLHRLDVNGDLLTPSSTEKLLPFHDSSVFTSERFRCGSFRGRNLCTVHDVFD